MKRPLLTRYRVWYCCTGYASIFSPLINFGLGHIDGSLAPWQIMYLFAGFITIVWGVAIWFVLPPDPIRAKNFDERERYILVARLRSNNTGVRNTHFKIGQVGELSIDIKFWLLFAIAFLSMIANGPISTFIPIIISSFGFTTLHSLLLVIPAGVYAGTLQLIAPYIAYKYKNTRTWLVFVCQLGTTLAALLLWVVPRSQKGALLFACYILPSVGGGYAVLMGLQVANIAGYTKRSIASSGLYVGYCLGKSMRLTGHKHFVNEMTGNFAGPLLFRTQDAPDYAPGFIATLATALAAGVLALVYRYVCIWENRRRDNAGIAESYDHAYEDDMTDLKVRINCGLSSMTSDKLTP